jgi:predicted esterase YcpF (UPF0227 family)
MNILYIHGFGSAFDPESEKVKALGTLGTVYGVNLDYTMPFEVTKELVADAIQHHQIDLIVGTSMGGYTASQCAAGIPFVAINPAIDPATSLQKYLGWHTDYSGNKFCLTPQIIQDLPKFNTVGAGLILLDLADEVIDANITQAELQSHYKVVAWAGGHHRFAHIAEALPIISDFYFIASINYEVATE